MNFCSACGTALNANARFCSSCGTASDLGDVESRAATTTDKKKLFIVAAGFLLLVGTAFAVGSGGTDTEEMQSDTEGYYEQPTYVRSQPTYQAPQPKTCLEWRTNYRYQPGAPSQFGQPINPGSQVPTGQTCVRYG